MQLKHLKKGDKFLFVNKKGLNEVYMKKGILNEQYCIVGLPNVYDEIAVSSEEEVICE